MNTNVLSRAATLTAAGEPFAVATVVRREAPSSAQLGDTAIITRDGHLHGFIGGSCTRSTVVHQALQVLADNEARLISFRDDEPSRADDIVSVPTTCHSGGSVEVYIDPVFPAPRLVLLGSSPVNQALAGLGAAMGYTVQTAGSADDDATGRPASPATAIPLDRLPALADREDGVLLYALVATMGEFDEDMLEAALAARPDYLGVIASRRRMEEIRATLKRRGASTGDIEAIDGPAGLDIGATRPEEIAVSILAKIVALRRPSAPQHDTATKAEGARQTSAAAEPATPPDDATQRDAATQLTDTARTTAAPRRSAGTQRTGTPRRRKQRRQAPETAIDPVCGMEVVTGASKLQAEHDGSTYHFCSGRCRGRFLEDPETYLAAAGIEDATGDGESA